MDECLSVAELKKEETIKSPIFSEYIASSFGFRSSKFGCQNSQPQQGCHGPNVHLHDFKFSNLGNKQQ
jgi:hypothetical protein